MGSHLVYPIFIVLYRGQVSPLALRFRRDRRQVSVFSAAAGKKTAGQIEKETFLMKFHTSVAWPEQRPGKSKKKLMNVEHRTSNVEHRIMNSVYLKRLNNTNPSFEIRHGSISDVGLRVGLAKGRYFEVGRWSRS